MYIVPRRVGKGQEICAVGNVWYKKYKAAQRGCVGRGSVFGIANRCALNGPGNKSRWEIFRNCPDRPWGPPSLLYSGYLVSFLRAKRSERGVDHPLPSSAEVKESVKAYFYFPSGPSWPLLGLTLPLRTDVPTATIQHCHQKYRILQALSIAKNELLILGSYLFICQSFHQLRL